MTTGQSSTRPTACVSHANIWLPVHLIPLLSSPAPVRASATTARRPHTKCLAPRSCYLSQTNQQGETPLHLAARFGHMRIATLLIGYGAEVDFPDSNGLTPLMKAAHEGHAEMATLLLENGADRERSSKGGDKAIDYAYSDEIRYLLRSPLALAPVRRPDPEKPEPPEQGDAKSAADEKKAVKLGSARAVAMHTHERTLVALRWRVFLVL